MKRIFDNFIRRLFDGLIPPSSGTRFPALDGLRGLAALAVMVSHLSIFADTPVMRLGSLSVCIFFTLSAFLLYYPYVSGHPPLVRAYFIRRFWRIYPPYTAMLLFGLVSVTISGIHGPVTFINFIVHLLFLQNFFPDLRHTMVAPTWSLASEVQFYILLPIFALLFAGKRFWGIILAIVLATTFQLGKTNINLYSNIPYILVPFFIGMVSAKAASIGKKPYAFLLILALFGFGSSFAQFDWKTFWTPFGIIPSLASGLLIYSLAASSNRVFASHPMRLIGISGYSLFMIHRPLFNIIKTFLPIEYEVFLGIPLAVILAIFSYRFIEAPAIRFAHARLRCAIPQPAIRAAETALP